MAYINQLYSTGNSKLLHQEVQRVAKLKKDSPVLEGILEGEAVTKEPAEMEQLVYRYFR